MSEEQKSESLDRFDSYQQVRSSAGSIASGKSLAIGLLVFALLLSFTPWQQSVDGYGRVVAFDPSERQQSLDAPIEGRILKWYVREGSRVEAGAPIVELTDNDPEILERLASERIAIQKRLDAARTASQLGRKNLERQTELFRQGLTSKRSLEQTEIELARYLAEESNASAELARLEVRFSRQNNQVITAPRPGTILRTRSGDLSTLVKSGQQLAILVPETDSRSVEIWLNGNDVPLVTPGREVRIQFEGWPAIQFSGWPSVAIGSFPGIVQFVDAADDGSGKFRIVVSPVTDPDRQEEWPSPHYLRQGVRAHAWVLLEQVSLGYEIWRRFNDFPPMLSGTPGSAKSESKGSENNYSK